MLTGILTVCSLFSLYTSVVHATDSHINEVTHIEQPCGGQYVLTPCKSVILASVVRNTQWRVPVKNKSTGLTLTYLSLLLVTISTDIELNPGPVSFPCGSCSHEILDNDPAISCDECQQWFHIYCQDISLDSYETLQANGVCLVMLELRLSELHNCK